MGGYLGIRKKRRVLQRVRQQGWDNNNSGLKELVDLTIVRRPLGDHPSRNGEHLPSSSSSPHRSFGRVLDYTCVDGVHVSRECLTNGSCRAPRPPLPPAPRGYGAGSTLEAR